MDETFHESESSTGGVTPSADSATAGPEKPQTVQFGPVEAPEQPVPPAGPNGDGFPGGETPESSGFSWRLPGQQLPAQQVQGGIPNEFDHLFRGSPADDRRSLMPGQGPIGISVPGAGGYPQNGGGYTNGGAANGGPATTQALPPADGTGPQPYPSSATGPQPPYSPSSTGPQPPYPGSSTGPQPLHPGSSTGPQPPYQPPTQDQVGYPQQGLPSRAYDAGGYSAQAQGYPASAGPEQHTQAIPRVQGHSYGDSYNGEPDLLLATAPGKRQANTTLFVALGVFVVLIVVAAVAFSGGGGKAKNDNAKKGTTPDTPAATSTSAAPAPPGVDPEAKKQADAIFQIIAQSKELRSQANGAVGGVQQCKNMAENKQTFADVAAKRQGQADAVKGQPVDKLPGGAKLASDLITAWQLSAESENDYVAWATDNLSCTTKPGANDNLNKANSAGTKAGSAKAEAVKDWNAFASQVGVQTIGVNDL